MKEIIMFKVKKTKTYICVLLLYKLLFVLNDFVLFFQLNHF